MIVVKSVAFDRSRAMHNAVSLIARGPCEAPHCTCMPGVNADSADVCVFALTLLAGLEKNRERCNTVSRGGGSGPARPRWLGLSGGEPHVITVLDVERNYGLCSRSARRGELPPRGCGCSTESGTGSAAWMSA